MELFEVMTFERIKELYVLVINGFVNCIKRTLPTLNLHCAFERWIIPSLPI
jgi:hypothetical protein